MQSVFRSLEANSLHVVVRLEGPGDERREGPRHDNDFVEIAQIQIAPTNGELVCRIPPYLPYNVPNAPHTYAADSIQRLLDIQFRLLREELT